jgi:3-isopropylmalate/(R)-2-methylmalate dehydratase large subunit
MNLIEKILADHSGQSTVRPGDIIDVEIDARVARDFGGANVVKNLEKNGLEVQDISKTFFTFDCNPGGSDQKYAENQQYCRLYARKKGLKVFDVDSGIGTHLAIDKGFVYPGSTFVSTDSHANIMGAVGAFGQGMGDQDIAAVWASGKSWFKVPKSAKLTINGELPKGVTAKDITLNLLNHFGANTLLGYSVELYGEMIEKLTLDERITIASMATEMGAIILLFPPSDNLIEELYIKTTKKFDKIIADKDAKYDTEFELNASSFERMLAKPGHPHDNDSIDSLKGEKIDSAFIGSCTNGRIDDLRRAAAVLKGRKVAPGVVLKIVPSTDAVWQQALEEGLVKIFKDAGALLANAGCAGCAAGQIGQNGPEEITISTGNRNFSGKQGKGYVYLASPETVAASAIAGYITSVDDIPEKAAEFKIGEHKKEVKEQNKKEEKRALLPMQVEGRVWVIKQDDIDTDMIFHNKYLTITDINEMGQYTFDNLDGYKDFATKAQPNDIIITTKNFGAGSSRQQAVDCFKALSVSCVIAESYGAIYERNAINAAFPILNYDEDMIQALGLETGHNIKVDFETGKVENTTSGKTTQINPLSSVQIDIYKRGGLLAK